MHFGIRKVDLGSNYYVMLIQEVGKYCFLPTRSEMIKLAVFDRESREAFRRIPAVTAP